MKPAAVGLMRERVAIEAQSTVTDAAGAITTTWSPVATVWARMKPINAQQLALAGRDEGVRTYIMTIRYRTDITTAHSIVWRGRKFDVQGIVDETEQRQFMTVTLREIGA